MTLTRQDCAALDAADPLRELRALFTIPDGVNYLDGNSPGTLPLGTASRLGEVIPKEWGEGLVRSCNSADPIRAVPRTNEPLAPLLADHFAEPRRRPQRQRAERVAVEVDHPWRQREQPAIAGDRVRRVERARFAQRDAQISVLTAKSSGKKPFLSTDSRYGTPAVPPVPRLKPMIRSTVLRCAKRQRWKWYSRSTSFSASS